MEPSANHADAADVPSDSDSLATEPSAKGPASISSGVAPSHRAPLWLETVAAQSRRAGTTSEIHEMVPGGSSKVEKGHEPSVSPSVPCPNMLRSDFLQGESSLVATGRLL